MLPYIKQQHRGLILKVTTLEITTYYPVTSVVVIIVVIPFNERVYCCYNMYLVLNNR